MMITVIVMIRPMNQERLLVLLPGRHLNFLEVIEG